MRQIAPIVATLTKEIKDRVNYYRNTAFEAQGLIDRNKKQAMSILQKLKGELEEEYKYYRLSRVEKVFFLMNDLVINNLLSSFSLSCCCLLAYHQQMHTLLRQSCGYPYPLVVV